MSTKIVKKKKEFTSEEAAVIEKMTQTAKASYAARRMYWPAYTWPVQTSYSTIIKENEENILAGLPGIDKDTLLKHLEDLFNKVNATFYHLQQLKASEKKAIEMGLKLSSFKPPGFEKSPGVVGVFYEPTLYEYEALLSSSKTSLDVLSIIIAKCLSRKEDNIVTLLNNLNQIKKRPTMEEKLKSILNKPENASFIDTFNGNASKRNYATHKGSLPIGTINIPVNNAHATIIKSKAHDPQKPIKDQMKEISKTVDLEKYCEEAFYSMADIIVECLEVLLYTKFDKGVRASRQEECMRQ